MQIKIPCSSQRNNRLDGQKISRRLRKTKEYRIHKILLMDPTPGEKNPVQNYTSGY